MSEAAQPAVIAIVGPTASGKSALALRVAQAMDAEIVGTDSMQAYRGMNIGTAKPNEADQRLVRHHMPSRRKALLHINGQLRRWRET
ncbi:MAG: isopentenyl transferase family protein [Actinomycetota bacterium]|nr:isopentenyl transferase family protein [Actinomycetota bacterium]